MPIKIPEPMRTEYAKVCKHCGFTKGSHHGGASPWPYDYCPGHEDGEYRYDD